MSTEADFIATVFNAVSPPWAAATSLDVHLHTAEPGESSAANEANYGAYAPVAVSRNASGWTLSGDTARNAAMVQFPQCTSGSSKVTHTSITPHGSTQVLYAGALEDALAVSPGIRIEFAPGVLKATERRTKAQG